MTAESQPPPILGYATPDADGLPPWVPEAEELIEKGAPPKKISKFFRKSDHALRYYIKSMNRRFGPEALGDICACCGKEARELAIQIKWQALIPAKFMEFRLNDAGPSGAFTTMHSICQTCVADTFRRMGFLWRTRTVLGWLSLVGWLSFFGVWLLARTLFRRSYWNASLALILLGAYVLVIILTKLVGFLYLRRQSLLLRRTMPTGVTFEQVMGIVERNQGRVSVLPIE